MCIVHLVRIKADAGTVHGDNHRVLIGVDGRRLGDGLGLVGGLCQSHVTGADDAVAVEVQIVLGQQLHRLVGTVCLDGVLSVAVTFSMMKEASPAVMPSFTWKVSLASRVA